MLNTVALVAGAQLLASASPALAQFQNLVFSADSAVAFDGSASGTAAAFASSQARAASARDAASEAISSATANAFALARNTEVLASSGEVSATDDLERQDLIPVGSFVRACDCKTVNTVVVDDIRGISDEFCAGGNFKSSAGLSNMVWGFGQFLDHDLALTIEDEEGATIDVETEDDVMGLHRAVTRSSGGCKNTLNVHTPLIDAGPVYGSDESFTQNTLREPGTCRMRVAEGDFLPVTTNADEQGRFFFITGDVRVSEHAFLAAQHTVWVREHNRLCAVVEADPINRLMSVDEKFDMVRDIVIAKFQQVVLTEFLPALGIPQADVQVLTQPILDSPDVSVEFSIAYRLGHDLIGNDVGGMDIADAFNSETFYLQQTGSPAAPAVTYKASAEADITSIMMKLSTTKANEIDGKLSDALRNELFGRSEGQDLAGRNIFRGRELGLPTYAGLAECYGTTGSPQVEAETPDAWLGLLREPKATGEPLPPTLRAIIVDQFHRSFFGPGGFYWRTSQATLRSIRQYIPEVQRSTYASIIAANTGAQVSGNVFKA